MRERIAELVAQRAQITPKAIARAARQIAVSKYDVLQKLIDIQDAAFGAEQYSAAIRATLLLEELAEQLEDYSFTFSEIFSAAASLWPAERRGLSSVSRYRAVLASFTCPSSNCAALRSPVS